VVVGPGGSRDSRQQVDVGERAIAPGSLKRKRQGRGQGMRGHRMRAIMMFDLNYKLPRKKSGNREKNVRINGFFHIPEVSGW